MDFNRIVIGFFILFFLGCAQGGGGTTEISIDIAGAQALFTLSSDEITESTESEEDLLRKTTSEDALGTLKKLLADGTVQSVILEDGQTSTVTPENPIFIGPDSKIYITFNSVAINGAECRLVRVTVDGNAVECYGPDNGYSSLADMDTEDGFLSRSPEKRFDEEGNFYFLDWEDTDNINVSYQILKKLSPSGEIITILTSNYWETPILRYMVLQDGTVIIHGRTEATEDDFTRRVTESGGVANLNFDLFGDGDRSLFKASNGDLLFSEGSSVFRLTWDGSSFTEDEIGLLGTEEEEEEESSELRALTEDENGNLYRFYSDDLYRFYPTDPEILISVFNGASNSSITLERLSGDYLYFSGTDPDNNYFLSRINLTEEVPTQTDLLNGENIEIYRFQVWSNGNILFGGLRLSDNQLILGEIDGETLEMTVKTTTTTRIDDLILIQ